MSRPIVLLLVYSPFLGPSLRFELITASIHLVIEISPVGSRLKIRRYTKGERRRFGRQPLLDDLEGVACPPVVAVRIEKRPEIRGISIQPCPAPVHLPVRTLEPVVPRQHQLVWEAFEIEQLLSHHLRPARSAP